MRTHTKMMVMALCLWAATASPAAAQVKSVVFVSGLNSPLEFVQHPTLPGVQFVVQQGGIVRVVQNGVVIAQPFLDVSTLVSTGSEQGLLGLAFAPDHASSGRVFINFTNLSGHTVVARYTRMASDPLRAEPASRFDLRWGGPAGSRFIAQPFANHNGGHLEFGPDGYLYIGMGDGGSGGDPGNRAQDPTTLLGKMLRIDIDVADSHPEGYVVPAGNPFADGSALPEIWSFGLRNPWKFTFDATGSGGAGTNAMVLGDVGQGAREEINYEPAGEGGRNYGWRLREGFAPYLPNTPPAFLPLTDPILDYPRTEGRSVTGGFVYRGSGLVSGFRGRYFYADFVSGRVWSVGLALDGAGEASVTDRVEHTAELGGTGVTGNIAAFGRDSAGELYLVSFNGSIIRIAHDPSASGPIGGSLSPFGQVDTPLQNAAGVVGAIGVTGWALDDTGVANVRVYRNCLTGVDNPASCQPVLGTSMVFVGEAAFLPGARPDVEAAFPSFPNANRAGWGMQVLTLMLPHVPNGQTTGGQGPMTLFAVATDLNGQLTLLGRSYVAGSPTYSTPTSITMANDTIAKPFGTLDTPTPGSTVSGSVANFGWVLTPDANTTVDGPVDIVMPVNGSTMVVYIDGVPVSTVAYDQCRGTVGNPVPGGVYCNDDISNLFGNVVSQPPLTSRSSNPTRHRNLDAGRGAIGAYLLNTATLSNGLHTIAWGVEDSAGRSEGIGSRFFIVQNGGAFTPRADQPAMALGAASALTEAAPSSGTVWGRTGFSRAGAWQRMRPNSRDARLVRLPEMGRLELWFQDAPDAGFLVANGTLRDLPVGSVLEGQRFTWAPGPGYVGTYTLAFRHGDTRTGIQVTIAPSRTATAGESQVRMSLDSALSEPPVRGRWPALSERFARVEGWAFDPDASIGSGVGAVHVWADSARGPVFLGAADLDLPGNQFALRSTVSLPPGHYAITAYVWLERTGRWEDARTVTLVIR